MPEKGNSTDLAGIVQVLRVRGTGGRVLVAVAGAPGSGKSTFAEELASRLNLDKPDAAAILPMDGYHFDDRILAARGLKSRKGSPETFDVLGLRHMLARLKRNDEPEVAVPVFDRDLEIARAGARIIERSIPIVIVEGNYLLLRRPGWSDLFPLFDTTIMVVVPEDVRRERLIERWRGYDLPPDEIVAKVEGNDMPNGRVVVGESRQAEFQVATSA
ncbi:MAG TPA: nucleoside/nucleotide kinase family protein [Acetobacteraceae bacterium]|nr:nucleoside/nucleotide kinase family protein [Acetobacteraceae bacterium]